MIEPRDHILLGAPGALGLWIFDLVKQLVPLSRSRKPATFFVERTETIPPLPAGAEGRILLCHYPNAQIVKAISASHAQVTYISEPARQVAEFLVHETGRTPIEAVRVCSASYVANLALRYLDDAAMIERSLPRSALQIASSLSARFGLDEAADDRKKLVDRFTGGRSNEPLDVAVKNYRRARAENEADAARHDVANLQHLVASILVPMHDMAFVDEPHAIIWPAECFYLADEPDAKKMASSNAFIELTGPSRMLLHGPYLHLPAARYRAAITLDVRDFAKDCIFRVDVSCGATELGKFRLVPRKPGRSIAEFEFEVVDPIPEIQAQLVAERGAIFGQVKLERLTLTPVTAASLKPRTAPQPGDIMQACER